MNTIDFMGFRLYTGDMDDTVKHILHEIESDNLLVREDLTAFKVTSSYDADIHQSISEADIVNADGMSIVKACKFINGVSIPRVTGCDLFQRLLHECATNCRTAYFLGATEESLQGMLSVIRQRFNNSIICGFRNGYFQEADWDDICNEILTLNPDIIFIGTPSPQKERFSNFLKTKLTRGLIMGVGGSFDIVSGKVKRAPKWMQDIGFEWLYRLIQEPRKMWRRYLTSNTRFIFMVALTKARKLCSPHQS